MRLEGMMVLNVELKWTNSILKQELVLSSCERTKGSGHGESVRCPPDLAIGQMELSRVAGRDIYIYTSVCSSTGLILYRVQPGPQDGRARLNLVSSYLRLIYTLRIPLGFSCLDHSDADNNFRNWFSWARTL